MTRKVPSLPARWLVKKGYVPDCNADEAKVLDYGCGKGMDANTYGWDKWDIFMNEKPTGPYDFITCTYVLNTIDTEKEVGDVIWSIQKLLKRSGVAFISVRRDKRCLTGKNSRGFQWLVELEGAVNLRENSTYAIYKVGKLCQITPKCQILKSAE